MDDNAALAVLNMARGRARWFFLPGAFWLLVGFMVMRGNVQVLFAFTVLASPFFVLWYFGSKGKAWAFFVGVLLNGIITIASLFTAQIVGAGISGFVTLRLWSAFIDCAGLETARRAHAEAASRLFIPSRVATATPAAPLGRTQPARIADESEAPPPVAWSPYRPQQSAPPADPSSPGP